MVFLVSKKTNKIDDEEPSFQQTKKKNKPKKNEEAEVKKQKKVVEDDCGLFQKIEKESEIVSKKNKPGETKLQNFFDTSSGKKEEKQKISSKTSYMPSSYVAFDNGDFPELAKKPA